MAMDWISALEAGVPQFKETYRTQRERRDVRQTAEAKAGRETQELRVAIAEAKHDRAMKRYLGQLADEKYEREFGHKERYLEIAELNALRASQPKQRTGGGYREPKPENVPLGVGRALGVFLGEIAYTFDSETLDELRTEAHKLKYAETQEEYDAINQRMQRILRTASIMGEEGMQPSAVIGKRNAAETAFDEYWGGATSRGGDPYYVGAGPAPEEAGSAIPRDFSWGGVEAAIEGMKSGIKGRRVR